MTKEIEIPEGYEAKIEDNKVIFVQKESEDERIRKWILEKMRGYASSGIPCSDEIKMADKAIDYLEKQKEQKLYWKPTKTDVALLNKAIITNNTLTPTEREQLDIIRSRFGYCRASNCNGIVQEKPNSVECSDDEKVRKALINYFKSYDSLVGENWNGIECDDVIAYLERQKEASKAIEAVEKIDKYIDEHLANAHDMKDSNPDKKYYRGWDDALGKMAGILQDVYSDEKQKEQKPVEQLGGTFTSYDMAKTFTEGQNYVITHPERFGLCKPVEWSDEDKRMIDNIIYCLPGMVTGTIEMLPSLAKQYALRLKSLFPSWKPSEQEKDALRTAIHILTEERNFPKTVAQLQNILNAFEGKESRKDWKPSEDEERLIKTSISFLKDFADKGYENAVECIDWLKSKLNGDACK